MRKDSLTRAKLKVAGKTAERVVETFKFEGAERWTSRTIESFIDVEVGTRLGDAKRRLKGDLSPGDWPVPRRFPRKLYSTLVVRIIQRDMRVSLKKLMELLDAG